MNTATRKEGLTQLLNTISNAYFGSGASFEKEVERMLTELGLDFTPQPYGSQSFPDFLVHEEGQPDLSLECKSTKNHCPMWNGGYPKKNGLYLLTSKKNDSTTFFLGQDVLSEKKAKDFMLLEAQLDKLVKKHRDSWDEDPRGFDYYLRDMYTQSGGAEKTNYFSHSSREKCEQEAYNFLDAPLAVEEYTFEEPQSWFDKAISFVKNLLS